MQIIDIVQIGILNIIDQGIDISRNRNIDHEHRAVFPLVLDLLLVDETNPRGIAFQLSEIVEHVGHLPKASKDAVRTPEQRLALEMLTQVRLADIEVLRKLDENGERALLREMLDQLIKGLPELSDVISRRYFSLTEEQPQRVHTRLTP